KKLKKTTRKKMTIRNAIAPRINHHLFRSKNSVSAAASKWKARLIACLHQEGQGKHQGFTLPKNHNCLTPAIGRWRSKIGCFQVAEIRRLVDGTDNHFSGLNVDTAHPLAWFNHNAFGNRVYPPAVKISNARRAQSGERPAITAAELLQFQVYWNGG